MTKHNRLIIKLRAKLLKQRYLFVYRLSILQKSLKKNKFTKNLHKKHYLLISGAGLAILLGIVMLINPSARAATYTLSADDIMDGKTDFSQVQLSNGNTSVSLQRGDVGQWNEHDGLQMTPTMIYKDTNFAYGPNNTLYMLTGIGSCRLFAYRTETQVWDEMTVPPVGCGKGNSLVYDGSANMYYLPGNDSTAFFKFDIDKNSWSQLASMGAAVGAGSSASFVNSGTNSAIYLTRGASSTSFWQYSVQNNQWVSKASFPNSRSVDYGLNTVWDGANNIYVISNNYGEFKRYSIASNTWVNITAPPNTSVMKNKMVWINGAIYDIQLHLWNNPADTSSMTKYNPGSDSWTAQAPPPAGSYYDFSPPATYDGGDSLYTLFGSYVRPQPYKFSISQNKWLGVSLFNLQDITSYHWNPIYDGGQSAYFIGGRNNGDMNNVYHYDLATKTTTQIGAQFTTHNGTGGVYKSNQLYTMPMRNENTFLKYDLASNDWISLGTMPFINLAGSELIDGGDGYLYATFGSRREFYKYSEGGGWQRLADMGQAIGAGGGIARIGRTIYALTGNTTATFSKYNIDTNTWSAATESPVGSVSYGGLLISDTSRYLYANLGTRTDPQNKFFYRYDTADSTWLRMADMPQDTQVGSSGFYDTVNNRVYVAQGNDTSHLWNWQPSSSNFVTTGSWYSKTIDAKGAQAWQSLNATVGGTGSATFYTRTSSNGGLWSDWQQVNSGTVQSPLRRYMQIKLTMTGSGTTTPIVNGITLNYAPDTTAPTLPSQFTAKDKKDGQTLISGQTYQSQHPYFTWNGSNDGSNGSGVDGYYVYYGSDSNADPAIDGNYQKTTDYTVTSAMTAGSVNYLRIKAKDAIGNISDTTTYFSYRYWYISPPGSILTTTKDEFGQGTNIGVDISDAGVMSLPHKANGTWATGTMQMLPNSASGPAMAIVDDYMYMVRGNDSADFWRYNIVNQTWETLNSLPGNANSGSALAWDKGNYIYSIRGNSTANLYRYNIQNNSWETLPNLPAYAQAGTDMKFLGNNRLAIIFSGSTEFYFYNISSGTYESKTSAPISINAGSSGSGLWFDGNDTVYSYFGPYDYYQSDRRCLMAYSISQDVWRPLAQSPIDTYYAENNLVGDGRGGLYIFSNDLTYNQNHKSMAAKYDIASDTWKVLTDSGGVNMKGSATSDGKRYLYMFARSASIDSRKIVQYDTWDERFLPQGMPNIASWQRIPWDGQSSWNWQSGQATTAIYDGVDKLFAIGANEGSWSRFMRYSMSTGRTDYLSPPPFVGIGGSLAYLNGVIYYMPAKSTPNLYKYDMNTQSWTRLTNLPTNVYRPGSNGLIAAGGALYAFTGNNRQLYRFTPDGGSGSWTRMTDVPGTTNVLGGGMSFDGTGNIYILIGNNNSSFYKYNISGNSWTTLANLPVNAANGVATVFKNGKIYASSGSTSVNTYLYDIGTNNWQAGAAAPEPFGWGSTLVDINDKYALSFAGQDSPDIWRLNYAGDDVAYSGQATHISQPISANGLFDYASIKAQVTIPENTKIEFWTRTSADNITWDDWQITDQVKYYSTEMTAHVASTPRQYTQIKAIMYSFDNLSTPTIDSYALDYYYDTSPPTNPTLLSVYTDQTKTTPITNNVWNNNSTPYLDWPEPGETGGATDGPLGSNIKGYWIYVGTDPTAQPQTAGIFVEASQYIPTLTTSGTYYVRLQAMDLTGNVDSNVFAPFIYKFDNTPPTVPALITVTPAGFTSNNNFTFQWPNAFDADSGIDKYCYHTGALSGPFSIENCQDEVELKDLEIAYRSGTNVFYLRTRDLAGNYSASYTTVSYYYSTDPPSPVLNLRAVPPVSAQNLFAFTWDLPLLFAGDPDQLSYCYSINELPTEFNTTCTPNKYISAFKAATQQGTNIIYMVAKDESNNVNWNSYASGNFIANTVSPGIPLNLVVSDNSDKVTNRWALTSTWTKPTFEGNGIARYVIERSDDGHIFTEIGQVSNTAYVDLTVLPETTYYYRIRAADNVDNRGGPSGVVAQSAQGAFATPPEIVSEPKAQPSFDQATISWVTSRASTSFVYYGTSPTQINQSKGSLDNVSEHNMTLTGLLPSTNYYFKVQSFDNDRSYDISKALSQFYTFKTTANARITDVHATDISLDSAILNWQTSVPTSSLINYGLDAEYGYSQDDSAGFTSNHIFKLGSLTSGTYYHYKIVATTEYGSQVSSDDYNLKTIERPIISNVQFQPMPDEVSIAVKVSWTTNVPTSSDLTYRALGVQKKESQADLVTQHEIILTDMASNTEYQFDVQGRDQYGNLTTSSGQTWKSTVDTRPPSITGIAINVNAMETLSGKAQLIISWKTDEPSTTQLQYGEAGKNLDKKTSFDPEPTVSHVVVVSNLELSKVYSIQPVSRDISGNTTYGAKLSTVTPDKEQSALDVVLNVLQRIFWF